VAMYLRVNATMTARISSTHMTVKMVAVMPAILLSGSPAGRKGIVRGHFTDNVTLQAVRCKDNKYRG
jgi:hypothetical protein